MNGFTSDNPPQGPVYVVQPPRRSWVAIALFVFLMGSMALNLLLFIALAATLAGEGPTNELHHSGDATAKDKIALLAADFTITPPFTEDFIELIEEVGEDDAVKGVLVTVDSPGGLVTDSHQIYHALQELAKKKPVYFAMKGIAASGGYYIAMGGGPEAVIFAEPTTWTGSIGVILPRYNMQELGEKIGVTADSIATGPLKDTLNPFKDLTEREREVWAAILDDAFQKFLQVIDEGRANLDLAQIRELATGQVYTADQAVANGLVDKIGYAEDAIEALKSKLGLTSVNVVEYESPPTIVDLLLGASAMSQRPSDPLTKLLEGNVPRAMYMFGWSHGGLLERSR